MIDDSPGTVFPILFVVLVLSVFVLFISLISGVIQSIFLVVNNEFAFQRLVPAGISAGGSTLVAVITIGLMYLSSALQERFPALHELDAQAELNSRNQTQGDGTSHAEAQWDMDSVPNHIGG